ncbi:MAG: hypothetical protein AB7J28_07195 [Hyphomonadaceae bacterium]
MRRAALLFSFVLSLAAPAYAQGDEIVVTASRYLERYEDAPVPQIAVVRRADFVVAQVWIESDTRDLAARREELLQTLREVERRARATGPVTVALLEESDDDSGETRVKPYTLEAAQAQIVGGTRPDTSRVAILLRTAVRADDALATAEERLDAFMRGVPRPGRVTVGFGEPGLTIVDPGQYRGAIVAAIAADARAIVAAVGPGHAIRIEGLESRIAWRRSADLELTLYIPHRLQIVPARE